MIERTGGKVVLIKNKGKRDILKFKRKKQRIKEFGL